jgi:hypothetical protein
MTLAANIECHAIVIRVFEPITAVLLFVSVTKYASRIESKSESASFISTNNGAKK